jgi:hypothetical protein
VISPEELEEIFSKTIRDYIFHFNMLERNMGYSLDHVAHRFDEYKKNKQLSELPFCEKIKTIKKIVSGKSLNKQFEHWFQSIDHCRKLRNFIVHGHWETKWFLEKQIHFDSTNMNVADKSQAKGNFTVEEFTQELKYLKVIANEFSGLRTKYEF